MALNCWEGHRCHSRTGFYYGRYGAENGDSEEEHIPKGKEQD